MIPPVEERIIDDIITDLSDRNGLRQEWEQIDEETQYEIKRSWSEIIRMNLKLNNDGAV